MPYDSLFRREALEGRATQRLGSIRIAQPIGDRVAAALACGVIAALGSFAVFGTYTKRATVPGLLEPHGGVVRLTAPSVGTVASVAVREGEAVRAGDVLFVLSGERRSTSGATQGAIGARLETRRATLERDLTLSAARHASRVRTTRERLDALDVEGSRLSQETAINASRQRIADQNVARFEALSRTGFIAIAQVQARTDDALVLRAQGAGLERAAAGLARERAGLSSQIVDSGLQADGERAEIERALAALDQERSENDARRSTVIDAPRDARVTAIAARVGQVVATGSTLATLIPQSEPIEAVLYASTRQAGFVAPGQRVHLRYAAYPYQKFGMGDGVVELVEQSPYAPQELPPQVVATLGPSGLQGNEPVYRIVVRVVTGLTGADGLARPSMPGMVVEADILQDRRRLIEWLFEPLYGLAGRTSLDDRPLSTTPPKADARGQRETPIGQHDGRHDGQRDVPHPATP